MSKKTPQVRNMKPTSSPFVTTSLFLCPTCQEFADNAGHHIINMPPNCDGTVQLRECQSCNNNVAENGHNPRPLLAVTMLLGSMLAFWSLVLVMLNAF